MTHELKIQKQWADAKLAGEKPFEIRRNDRGFQKGDTVRYSVVDPKTSLEWRDENDDPHPLELCDFLITYVIEGKDGLEKGYCVYADQPVPRRPVSADLGSGATPSNGTAEPLAPPSPLAETSDGEVHTDVKSVPKSSEGCKDFAGKFDGTCRFAYATTTSEAFSCGCKTSANCGKRCPVERPV